KLDLDDLVHFGDVIDVDIVGGFEFDWRGTLTSDGFLDGLDGFSEQIYGLCRSENQIAADVARVYGKILRDPKVVVKIIDRSNRAVVRLDGAVRTAARFRLQRDIHLRELIVLAGGITDGASGDITIFRPKDLNCMAAAAPTTDLDKNGGNGRSDNGSQTVNIKISELLSGNQLANPQILSGDIVTVLRAFPIYVIGAVKSPRPIYSRDKMSVSRIVAIAGGLAKDADGRRVVIYRRSGTDVRSIETNLDKIKLGETEDEILQPFDIIEIAVKGRGNRKYPPVVVNDENGEKRVQDFPLRIVD
ncbi:MAG: SLBB domain-containing protein, partial [Pyrinomonadaceae bacterium]